MESDLKEIRDNTVEKKIYRLRHREGLAWTDVADKVNKEFDLTINSGRVQELYDKHISKATIIKSRKENEQRDSDKVNEEWNKEMMDLVNKIREKALKHLEIADKLLIEQVDNGMTNAYFKNLPTAIAVWRNILDQVNLISRRQEKIELTQKNYILNETQILQIVNNAHQKKAKETGLFIHPGTQKMTKVN